MFHKCNYRAIPRVLTIKSREIQETQLDYSIQRQLSSKCSCHSLTIKKSQEDPCSPLRSHFSSSLSNAFFPPSELLQLPFHCLEHLPLFHAFSWLTPIHFQASDQKSVLLAILSKFEVVTAPKSYPEPQTFSD